MIVIADASPLIGLSKISRLTPLFALYGTVWIPTQVFTDVVTNGKGRPGSRSVPHAIRAGHIKVVAVRNHRLIPRPLRGTGEGEVIGLARERKAALVILDDRLARRQCDRLGFPWISTAGVLLASKEHRIIRRIKPLLNRLERSGFGVFDYDEVLRAAGEN